jgi:hypothetical protein
LEDSQTEEGEGEVRPYPLVEEGEEEGHPSLQAAAEVVVVEEACCFEEQ